MRVCCSQEALLALNEAVRIAQQHNDNAALAHALGALCHILATAAPAAVTQLTEAGTAAAHPSAHLLQLLKILKRYAHTAVGYPVLVDAPGWSSALLDSAVLYSLFVGEILKLFDVSKCGYRGRDHALHASMHSCLSLNIVIVHLAVCCVFLGTNRPEYIRCPTSGWSCYNDTLLQITKRTHERNRVYQCIDDELKLKLT